MTGSLPPPWLPYLFPIFFIGMWLLVTTMLSVFSGWRTLQAEFPDTNEPAIAIFPFASGSMGMSVSYGNCLTVAACASGLRVATWRIFGPFDRPFLVPWDEISVERRTLLLRNRARLLFGTPTVGHLEISARLADKLSAAAGDRWRESAAFHRRRRW